MPFGYPEERGRVRGITEDVYINLVSTDMTPCDEEAPAVVSDDSDRGRRKEACRFSLRLRM
jgi:hypothetical protein